MKSKKIAVVTGSRAEYGLLYSTLKEIENDHELDLQLIVTGMHLEEKFGFTVNFIEQDGFSIAAKIPMNLKNQDTSSVLNSMGSSFSYFDQAIKEINPDIILVLGDRFEILVVAVVALFLKIPLAHIHGGELTEGALDESIRHSISKMAHLHFTSNEEHRRRVIQLGEQPSCVFNVGAPGLDFMRSMNYLSREELSQSLGIILKDEIYLVTYHPVTLLEDLEELNWFFSVLEKMTHASVILTLPNADPGSQEIFQRIENLKKLKHIYVTASLGQLKYLSMMKISSAVLGNSSSGIIEAPFFQVPTINVGSRQLGRMRSMSVVDVSNEEDFYKALIYIKTDDFQKKLKTTQSLYGDGHSGVKIKNVLKSIDLKKNVTKKFYDVNFSL